MVERVVSLLTRCLLTRHPRQRGSSGSLEMKSGANKEGGSSGSVSISSGVSFLSDAGTLSLQSGNGFVGGNVNIAAGESSSTYR